MWWPPVLPQSSGTINRAVSWTGPIQNSPWESSRPFSFLHSVSGITHPLSQTPGIHLRHFLLLHRPQIDHLLHSLDSIPDHLVLWAWPWSSKVDPQLSFITSPNYPVNGSQSNLSYTQHGDVSIVNKTWQGLLLPSFHKDENLDYTVWHTSLYSLSLSTFPAEWSCSFPEQPKLLSGPGLSLTLLLRPLADSLPRTVFKGHCYTNPFLTFHIFYIIHIFLGIFLVPIQTDLSNIYSISHITCLCSFVRLLKQRPSWFDFCVSTT